MNDNNVETLEILCKEDATIKVNVKDFIDNSLAGFEDFLKYIKQEKGDLINLVIERFISQCESDKYFGIQIKGDYDILQSNPELFKRSIAKLLDLLNYHKYQNKPLKEEIIVDVLDLVKGYILFDYIQAISILAIMSREETISFIKKYIRITTESRQDPDNFRESLKDYVSKLKNSAVMWNTHDGILKLFGDEKFVYKVRRCKWAEVLKDYDREICYSMMCYQDLFQVKNLNPDFTLTRTKTIMQGDKYCDFCYYDERKVKDIIHPSEKLWNELN